MKNPLVSIITPSYNQAQFIESTILSVLSQGYPNLEYLVVDGGSTDGSTAIIQRYANHLAWWVSEPDHGQAEAINKGFQRAKGQIIAWLNSDDYYLPNAIETAVRIFQENPQAGLVFGDVLSVDENGEPLHLQKFGDWDIADLMAFRIISQPAVLMRRSALERSGYLDSSFHLLLDHHLWLRVAQHAPMVYIPQKLAAARYHQAAKNKAQAMKFGQEAFRIVDWMKAQPALQTRLKNNRRRIFAGAHRLDAYYKVEGNHAAAGLHAYLKAFWFDPVVALRDWKRVIYALFLWPGFGKVYAWYVAWHRKRVQ